MMSDPVLHPADAPGRAPAEEAGCARFEDTLLLLDGALEGERQQAARLHADGCPLCGPMVQEWAAVSDGLATHFFEAAERAKPDLAGLADRVLAQVAPPAPKRKGLLDSLGAALRALQAPLTLVAAAAAIALVVGPLITGKATRSGGQEPVAAKDSANDSAQSPTAASSGQDPNGCRVVKLAFEGADGMVLETPLDGMTVIWVTEHEGA